MAGRRLYVTMLIANCFSSSSGGPRSDAGGGSIYAFVLMSNHLHVVLKTPEPNLARGMQGFLSAYANGWSRRHRFGGHVFQGRYRTELVEDESYLWTVTRYVHLNPSRARMVDDLAGWRWSSYPGYVREPQRLEWVAYDELLSSWRGAFGGLNPGAAYKKFVLSGIAAPPESPWKEAHHGWLLGSQVFADRIGAMVRGEPRRERRREARLIASLSVAEVRGAVCEWYGIDPAELSRRGSRHPARAAFAYLARRRTSATNAELAKLLGLSRPECVPNLTRRCSNWSSTDRKSLHKLRRLEQKLDESGGSG